MYLLPKEEKIENRQMKKIIRLSKHIFKSRLSVNSISVNVNEIFVNGNCTPTILVVQLSLVKNTEFKNTHI